jgi:hypothetical protein
MNKLLSVLTPVPKRPAFWNFISALVGFLTVFSLQDKVDAGLLLQAVSTLLVLLGVGSAVILGLDVKKAYSKQEPMEL